ncbi:hypothetical protein GCM10012275_40060 [Longimycelium tulufanense]|uniref:Uncharacterized protein n=1 Tax=Longimycelium tulufanense TaxID=907463 RepID=A0A8J3CF09_9PSEU|nr:hypothetical protein GCM10012275_40060 [Longimycelium tulufanense]
MPKRPKSFSAKSIDPCKLLTKEQQQRLGLDREPSMNTEGTDKHGNYGCSYLRSRSKPSFSYLAVPVPQEGADEWLKGTRAVEVKHVTVAGFGAVTTQLGESDRSCNTVVDIADGESLDIQFTGVTKGAFTHEQLCEKSNEFAELAMQNLMKQG